MASSKEPALAALREITKADPLAAKISPLPTKPLSSARLQPQDDDRDAMADRPGFFTRALRFLFLNAGWLVFLTVGILFTAALATYSASDPGFTATSTQPPANVCGLLGAWGADLLLWLFGAAAWWLPAMLLVTGLNCLRLLWSDREDLRFGLSFWLPIFGLALLLVFASALFTLQLPYLGTGLRFGAGGEVGISVANAMMPWLGLWGSTIVLVFLVALSIGLAFQFSWIQLCERVGAVLSWPFTRFAMKKSAEVPVFQRPEPVIAAAETAPVEAVPESVAVNAEGVVAPSLALLEAAPQRNEVNQNAVQIMSRLIESKLSACKISARVVGAQAGPVVTQYWLQLPEGVSSDRIEEVRRDLTRALSVHSVRVVPTIPGKPWVGLEIPHSYQNPVPVSLREVIGSKEFAQSTAPLSLALGMDVAGKPVVIDLAKKPHILVGGTAGSGKSVCINAMILSLLYKCTPEKLRLVLIDPKESAFKPYMGIPHLLCPVVTDMMKACNALNWLANEMDRRYALMKRLDVRSFDSFNARITAAARLGRPITDATSGSPVLMRPLPYIVCFVDELADLILLDRKHIETLIMRLAQKARAAGIHMVLSTQRPSTDVITPLIKANIVARICFQVASVFDSRVILDEGGAEDLLGCGDMLLRKPGDPVLERVQGCMVEEGEVNRVAALLRQHGIPDYMPGVTDGAEMYTGGLPGQKDPLYGHALELVIASGCANPDFLQQRFGIGFNRATNLLEAMESDGMISTPNASGQRIVLVERRKV